MNAGFCPLGVITGRWCMGNIKRLPKERTCALLCTLVILSMQSYAQSCNDALHTLIAVSMYNIIVRFRLNHQFIINT
jgi:hypothetical protein